MTNSNMIVTENRVIFGDDATAEQLKAVYDKYPNKTICRAKDLKMHEADTKSASQLEQRVARLEKLIDQQDRVIKTLMAAAQTQPKTPVVKAVDTTEPETPTPVKVIKTEQPQPQKVQTEKPKASDPAPVVETSTNRGEDKYSAMEKDELIRRVNKRGGNPGKIMAPFHARARTNALRDWLRANPPVKANTGKVSKIQSGKKVPTAKAPQRTAKTAAMASKLMKLRTQRASTKH